MTTAIAPRDGLTRVQIPKPLPHQKRVLDDDHRFKLWRAGRRTSKTRAALIASIIGHGPHDADGTPKFPGVAQGWDVAWIPPDYPQSRTIWSEEIRPRFKGRRGIVLNETEHTVSFAELGGGTLHVVSAEAIDGLRGKGARLIGAIFEEAAHLDLQYAWRSVVRPALMDNGGWAFFQSTTNSGHDGNAEKVQPSYFNRLCEQVRAGVRKDQADWVEFYHTARDNPLITASEFDALVAEYTPGARDLLEEVFAELLTGGAGLAFPEWDKAVHIRRLDYANLPAEWEVVGGLDWGYRSPGCLVLALIGPENRVAVRHELKFSERTPYDVGRSAPERYPLLRRCKTIAYDAAMDSVTDGGPTITQEFQRGLNDAISPSGRNAPALVPAPKGPGSRVAGRMLVHELLKFTRQPDGTIRAWENARLTVDPECTYLTSSIPLLVNDDKNVEDVDTDGDDHGYDALRYMLAFRLPHIAGRPAPFRQDGHPGFGPDWKRNPHPAVSWREHFGQGDESEHGAGYQWPGAGDMEEL